MALLVLYPVSFFLKCLAHGAWSYYGLRALLTLQRNAGLWREWVCPVLLYAASESLLPVGRFLC
jgi:hypothetical protein